MMGHLSENIHRVLRNVKLKSDDKKVQHVSQVYKSSVGCRLVVHSCQQTSDQPFSEDSQVCQLLWAMTSML
ncbi:hypothetical protein SKAU_G00015970 [Synaphobranchus kaupii]|uniref:Uncharacterized protein n=1 Tax=Synaphobranchus kaupii TaxID=118154 RepID=A0A9Q1JDZ1_SYNKA|nr:hypothetical protein SKAU_G00015970 [Synaphobranchus kaupii]